MAVTSKKPESWRHTKIARKYYRNGKTVRVATTQLMYDHSHDRSA